MLNISFFLNNWLLIKSNSRCFTRPINMLVSRSRNHSKTEYVKLGDWKHEISRTTLQSNERGSFKDEAYTCR